MSARSEENPDLLMMTLDALRFDVAAETHRAGTTPFLANLLPQGWEMRHTPGSFTYAAHAAFFAGFWPTPVSSGESLHGERPFALRFHGSRSVGPATRLLDGETIVEGLRCCGYHTICIGGVGFFNRLNPLGSVFPNLFDASHWQPEYGVGSLHSTQAQVRQAVECLDQTPQNRPVFLFVNVSATHSPTRIYLRGTANESVETQAAALAYVDRQLPPLFEAFRRRGRPGRAYMMADHGTLFGEEGLSGHRVAHPAVWNVPYGETTWGNA